MPTTAPPPPSLYELPPDEDQLAAMSIYDVPPGPLPYNPRQYDLLPGPSTSQLYDVPPVLEENTDHFNKLAEELLSTEERYLGDLLLAKKLFHDNLITLPYQREVNTIFRHWDQLINVSRKIYLGLKKCTSPGHVIISEIDSLSVFVAFCSHQQMALDALNQLLTHPDAQKLYTKCTSSVEARGMSLSTFLLMPLGRITRYPLLIEKILKESDPKGDLHQDLDTALQLLRALVSEVNHAVTEEENVFLLRWAQSHVKCPPSLRLDFTSDTRLLVRDFLEKCYSPDKSYRTLGILS
ncbi:RhoGEF domain protein [Teladorsagia circumcincta]|uniref:RhoGEF domain protein n=1 Tax=Teladorsagia circumcincta TaxID=45464 RepID=A0A2G9U4E8_TELCI|nr:RhoGEF domain protein [Teladorsagia circumcincta]